MNAIVLAVGLAAITCIDAMDSSSAMIAAGSRTLLADTPQQHRVAADEKVDPRIAAYDLGHACANAGGLLVREAAPDGGVSYRCYIEAH